MLSFHLGVRIRLGDKRERVREKKERREKEKTANVPTARLDATARLLTSCSMTGAVQLSEHQDLLNVQRMVHLRDHVHRKVHVTMMTIYVTMGRTPLTKAKILMNVHQITDHLSLIRNNQT